uniref:Uncharacterized protein n=1 Tax=Bionectria ochroleuca TaxID=29856 RepID=A0A0B7JL73_BIOOC
MAGLWGKIIPMGGTDNMLGKLFHLTASAPYSVLVEPGWLISYHPVEPTRQTPIHCLSACNASARSSVTARPLATKLRTCTGHLCFPRRRFIGSSQPPRLVVLTQYPNEDGLPSVPAIPSRLPTRWEPSSLVWLDDAASLQSARLCLRHPR